MDTAAQHGGTGQSAHPQGALWGGRSAGGADVQPGTERVVPPGTERVVPPPLMDGGQARGAGPRSVGAPAGPSRVRARPTPRSPDPTFSIPGAWGQVVGEYEGVPAPQQESTQDRAGPEQVAHQGGGQDASNANFERDMLIAPGNPPLDLSVMEPLPPEYVESQIDLHFHHTVQSLVRTGEFRYDPLVRVMLEDERYSDLGARLAAMMERIVLLPRGKYVRARYKPAYTHGPLEAGYVSSLTPAPPGVPGALPELNPDEAMGNDIPVCAGCNCALRIHAEDQQHWMYFLPCGHVIDGACRERLGRARNDPSNPSLDKQGRRGKRKRAASPVATTGAPTTEDDGHLARSIPCPVWECKEFWVYRPGYPHSATRLFA